MANERLMMQGKLAGLRNQRTQLQMKGKGLCRSIAPAINPVLLDIEEMEIALTAQQMDELVMVQAELVSVNSHIRELEKALGV